MLMHLYQRISPVDRTNIAILCGMLSNEMMFLSYKALTFVNFTGQEKRIGNLSNPFILKMPLIIHLFVQNAVYPY